MPAFESRRVRTQPLTVTGVSLGALPARISRTLNEGFAMRRKFTKAADPVQCQRASQRGGGVGVPLSERSAKLLLNRLKPPAVVAAPAGVRCPAMRDAGPNLPGTGIESI